jgi:hypothetical protein
MVFFILSDNSLPIELDLLISPFEYLLALLHSGYSYVRKVQMVLDNLNTHMRERFEEVLGVETVATLLRRIEFCYMPKHAS